MGYGRKSAWITCLLSFFPLNIFTTCWYCMLFLNLKCIDCFYLYSKVSTHGSIFQTNFLQHSHNSLTALLIMSCHSYVTVTAPVMFCIDMSFGLNILVLICYHQLKVLLWMYIQIYVRIYIHIYIFYHLINFVKQWSNLISWVFNTKSFVYKCQQNDTLNYKF